MRCPLDSDKINISKPSVSALFWCPLDSEEYGIFILMKDDIFEKLNYQENIENNEEIEIEEKELAIESDEDNLTKNNKKGVKLHKIKFKIKIATYAQQNSIKKTVEKYNVPRTTINDWIKNKNKYLSLDTNKLAKTEMHKGNPPLNTQVENELISFNRKLFNPITTYSLFLKLLQLWPEKKIFLSILIMH